MPVGEGSGVVIDAEAVAIARSETVAVGDLPVITLGPVGDLGDVQTLALPALKLIDAMPLDLAPWVETFDIDDAGTGSPLLRLDLVGDVVAIMGDDRDLDTKYEAVRSVLDQVDLAGICEIDVQVGDNPVEALTPVRRACNGCLDGLARVGVPKIRGSGCTVSSLRRAPLRAWALLYLISHGGSQGDV